MAQQMAAKMTSRMRPPRKPMRTTYVTGRVNVFGMNMGEGSVVGDAVTNKVLEEVGGAGKEERREGERG